MGTHDRVQRLAGLYRGTAIIVFNALLAFAAFETGACAILQVAGANQAPVNPREHVRYYGAHDWATQYWDEHRLSDVQRYHPYVVWRRAPFAGATITIDDRGFRVTPGAECAPGAYTVFALGGSTMWGTGAPQWGTIPAYLQAGLQARTDRPVCLVNLGESGFMSAQEVVQLLVLLQAGHRPDLVLFYDGFNDVYAAYQSGQPLAHMNLQDIRDRFELSSRPPSAIESIARSTYSFRLAGLLAVYGRPAAGLSDNVVTYEHAGVDLPTLAAGVTDAYLAQYRTVDALAREYGFQYLFFWQPAIWLGGKTLTDEERAIALNADPGPIELSQAVSGAVQATIDRATHEKLHSLVSVFDPVDASVWIDWVHVTPDGNRLIAADMIRIITTDDDATWTH